MREADNGRRHFLKMTAGILLREPSWERDSRC